MTTSYVDAALAVVDVGELSGTEDDVLLVAHNIGPRVARRPHR